MTAPRRKPERMWLTRISYEFENSGMLTMAEERKWLRERMWPIPLKRLRVERVRAKPKGKRP